MEFQSISRWNSAKEAARRVVRNVHGSLFLGVLLVAGCGQASLRPDPAPSIDLPALEQAERPVADAIESARRLAVERPRSAPAWGGLGMVLQAHAFHAPAVSAYQTASRLAPEDYRWLYLAGQAQRKLDQAAAVPFFEEAHKLNPTNAAFHVNFGDLLFERGDLDRARRLYGEALILKPDSGHALYGMAQIETREGNLENARDHLIEAARLNPAHGEAHGLLAQVYNRLGETELARIESIAARAHPEATAPPDPVLEEMEARAVSSQALSRRALALARRGEFAQAEAIFRRVIEIRPGKAGDLANLGAALAGQKRLDQALSLYRGALQIDPDDPNANNNMALALIEKGEPGQALTHARRAIQTDPNFAEGHQTAALAMQALNRPDEAAESLRRALEANPGLPGARNNLARVLALRKRLGEAIEQWRLAVAIDPLDLESLYNLGLAYAASGDHARSIQTLESAVRVAPNSSLLLRALAWELATAPDDRLRDGRRALDLSSRVQAQYPDDPAVADCHAAALAETGQFAEAAETLRKALAKSPPQRELLARRQLYLRGKPYRQAR